jgi:hypothetical protein
MKNIVLLLVLLSWSVIAFSQEIKAVDSGNKVTIVKDTSAINLANTFFAPKDMTFLLLENGEFRMYHKKTKKIYSATNLNKDIKEVEYLYVLLDDRKIKI